MLILAIDTSGASVSAAISDGLQILAQYTRNATHCGMESKMTHSQTLLPILDRLMGDLAISPKDVGAVALCNGPGSYTGLRIGLSTAKGIAYANDIPVIGVSTLAAMSYPHQSFEGNICPLIDARRDLVYSAVYVKSDIHRGELCSPEDTIEKMTVDFKEILIDGAYSIDSVLEFIQHTQCKTLFLGDGASLHKLKIQEILGDNAVFIPQDLDILNAVSLIPFAVSAIQNGKAKTSLDCALNYCRKPQAQRELEEKNASADIVIKPFCEDFVEAAAMVEAECFAMPWSKKSFEELLKNDVAKYFVALLGEEVAGIIGSRVLIDFMEISNVAVTKQHRRKGIASKLIQAVFDFGAANQLTDFTLEVRISDQGAIALYKKMGFKQEGVRKDFYERPREDGLIMWKH